MKVSEIYALAMEMETYSEFVEQASMSNAVSFAQAVLSLLDTIDREIGLSPDSEFPAEYEDVPFEQNWQKKCSSNPTA